MMTTDLVRALLREMQNDALPAPTRVLLSTAAERLRELQAADARRAREAA